jgi:serine/threonine protein kinase
MTITLFCDECGAAITSQVTYCTVCRHRIGTSSPRPLAQTTHVAPSLSMTSPTGPLQSGSLLAQRYLIVDQIGQGGFATVFKARDRYQKNKLVAVKQINLASLSPKEMIEATDSYNREITLLSRLRHDSLPRIYDQFTDPEHWYVVMDYIEGETLEDMLQRTRGGSLAVKKALDIAIALCDVLGYLHEQRPPIIFRDVKPANIMITPQGRIYLIDFGIARLYRPGQAKDTGALGSPGYAAPEQYGKAQTTPRSDIYGLGATLQTLITGKEPFEIQVAGVPLKRHVPAKLQAYITHMLEYDAGLRPQSMAEVKQQLQQLKAALIEQRLMRTCIITGKFLKHFLFSLFSILPLLLIIHVINCPFWLTSLAFATIIVGRIALGLRRIIQDTTDRLQMKDILATLSRVLWEHLPTTALFSFTLTMLFFCFYINALPDNGFQILDFLAVGVILAIILILGLFGLGSWLEGHAMARRRSRLRKQAAQQQSQAQQVQQHP